jgi:predicted 3-demethylubiquinone-9 3-methyltransferase (glyoxalase superfamily)
MCGWVKDKYGLSWQIIPRKLMEHQASPDRAAAERSQQAMLKMRKIIIADLDKAFAGK